jgi:hypothetical protein
MMAYKDRFVCAVKVDSRILRERDGRVIIPFGAEYSILLKNMESRNSSVKVSIDGRDVLSGRSLILHPNSSMELERFIEDSLDRGNRFRFIQKTQEIIDHRGDKIDDGMIRVEFAFETVQRHVDVVEHHHHHYDHHHHRDYWPWYPPQPYRLYYGQGYHCTGEARGESVMSLCSAGNFSGSQNANAFNLNPDEGITVKGSESQQHLHQGWIGQLDPSEVIIIRLSGEMPSGKQVETPIFVNTKIECGTCGRKAESIDSFCGNCGTAF